MSNRKAGGGRKATTVHNEWANLPLNVLIAKVNRLKEKHGVKVDTNTVVQVIKSSSTLSVKHLVSYGGIPLRTAQRTMQLLGKF